MVLLPNRTYVHVLWMNSSVSVLSCSHVATLYRFVNDDFMRFGWDVCFSFSSPPSLSFYLRVVCIYFAVTGSTVIGCMFLSFLFTSFVVWQNLLTDKIGSFWVYFCVWQRALEMDCQVDSSISLNKFNGASDYCVCVVCCFFFDCCMFLLLVWLLNVHLISTTLETLILLFKSAKVLCIAPQNRPACYRSHRSWCVASWFYK